MYSSQLNLLHREVDLAKLYQNINLQCEVQQKTKKAASQKKKKTIEKIERVVFLDSNKLSKEKKAASFRLIHSERTVIQKHTRTFLLHMKHVKPPLARFYQGIPLNSV